MDKARNSILDLNDDCKLEIIKYIIADCELNGKSHRNRMNYLDLVSFALAHEDLEAVLENNKNNLYKDLEFLFVANRKRLKIDFAQLQATHTGKAGDVFWLYFADAIRENRKVEPVLLLFTPESFQPEFLDHFQMIKCALENKRSLSGVLIYLNGYSLDDLSNFGHITRLDLNVRMSAEALVSVCKSNPELNYLKFMSTELQGRLSDIVPHCRNLRYLEFAAKPDVDLSEYAPLARLPNLENMSIHGASKNGSMLTMFQAIQKCQRSETYNFILYFCDKLPHLSSVTIVRNNFFNTLQLGNWEQEIWIRIAYKFMEISKDTSPFEQSLATISLIDADLEIESNELTLSRCTTADSEISEFSSLLRQFNIETLILINADCTPIYKIFASIPEGVISLKLVVINSKWVLPDLYSVGILRALTNLKTVYIEEVFNKSFLNTLFNLLKTCKLRNVIMFKDSEITCMKQHKVLRESTSLLPNRLGLAFTYRDYLRYDEILRKKNLKDTLKLLHCQHLQKKLIIIQLADTNGIGKLSELTQLEELTISHTEKGSLTKLFDQLVPAECAGLHIKLLHLSAEEVLEDSRIKSLKKLGLHVSLTDGCVSFAELVIYDDDADDDADDDGDDDPKELNIVDPGCKLINVYKSFASKSEKLTILTTQVLSVKELNEICRIKSLKTLTLLLQLIKTWQT